MPTRKSKKKTVSVVDTTLVSITPAEPCTTPPDPCPLCGRSGPIVDLTPTVEPPELDGPAVTAEEIEAAFDDLPVQLPPSVRKKISARLLKRGLHPTSEEGVEVVRLACEGYLAKKERARAASATRRAVSRADKQQKEAAIPDGDGTESP